MMQCGRHEYGRIFQVLASEQSSQAVSAIILFIESQNVLEGLFDEKKSVYRCST